MERKKPGSKGVFSLCFLNDSDFYQTGISPASTWCLVDTHRGPLFSCCGLTAQEANSGECLPLPLFSLHPCIICSHRLHFLRQFKVIATGTGQRNRGASFSSSFGSILPPTRLIQIQSLPLLHTLPLDHVFFHSLSFSVFSY